MSTLVQLGARISKIWRRRATLRNSRGAALSLETMADQNTSLGSLMEPKRSAELADHITSDDSDEDMLDEGPNDDDAAEISEEETETRQQCVCCTEEHPLSDIIQTECAHNYCCECIVRLFENSLANEALFPPRCCRLPIQASAAVEDMIGIEMAKRYKERKTEMSDYGRTYCAIPTCSHYIPPQNIRRGVGICGLCKARTCTDCKSQGHRGDCNYKKVKARKKAIAKEKAAAKKKATAQKRAMAKEKAIAKKKAMEEEMANDENYQLLEKLAKKKKWQRCSKCSRIIERVTGCWHVV